MGSTITIPEDNEAERFILGACIGSSIATDNVLDKINDQVFQDVRHQIIFQSIKFHWANNYKITAVSIAKNLEDTKDIQRAGGFNYIKSLEVISPSSHVNFYVDRVIDCYKRKLFILNSQTLTVQASDKSKKISDSIEEMGEVLSHLLDVNTENRSSALPEVSEYFREVGVYDWLKKRKEQLDSGVTVLDGPSTGFPCLDSILGGLAPNRLVVLGARPNVGKTEILIQFAAKMIKNQTRVSIFTMEMSSDEYLLRLLGILSGVYFSNLSKGKFTDEHLERVQYCVENLEKNGKHIIISDRGGLTTDQLRAAVRRDIASNGSEVIIIDHLGLMRSSKKTANKYEEVSDISRELKKIAMEFGVCILAAAQLNREVTKSKESSWPTMSNLRDSGSIEQDADQVILLHRDMYTMHEEEADKISFIIDKNRHGERRTFKFIFDVHTHNLEELSIERATEEIKRRTSNDKEFNKAFEGYMK